MNIALKKIVVAAIEHHWINGANDMVMGCANKYIFELME